jgi:hypothetical protein
MMGKCMEMMERMRGLHNPEEVCRQMASVPSESWETESADNPEVRALFEDWATEVEKEVSSLIEKDNSLDPVMIAEKLGISKESAVFFINRLARKGKFDVAGPDPN